MSSKLSVSAAALCQDRHMVRLAATLLVVVLVLGGGSGLTGRRTFGETAAQVVSTWRTSAAAAIWRTGFVPLEDLSRMPRKVSKQIGHDEEYGWVVAGPLPVAPARAQVRWDDGSMTRVPVIGPREALMALSPWPEGYSFPDGKAYKLTGATFTTMRLKTVRGMATVPAWRLYFSNLPGPIDHVAIDQEAVGTVEDAVSGPLPGDEEITDFKVLDGRRLLVSYEYGSCNADPLDIKVRVSEEPDVVVLGLDVPHQSTSLCAGTGQSRQDIVRLDTPLGDRVVLDATSRLPVLCHRARNACHAGNELPPATRTPEVRSLSGV
ncbi:hypothetical protein ACIBHX_42740 [Nonomuraea sp. NPDC050536]|uniref:hypothetical protein n=1 Tax=Nonomuraea sp. NPDC050536 TaxID=3364366 RepID=UPI0037CAA488